MDFETWLLTLLATNTLTATAKNVLVYLWLRGEEDSTRADIAEGCAASFRQIKTILESLEKEGRIERTKQQGNGAFRYKVPLGKNCPPTGQKLPTEVGKNCPPAAPIHNIDSKILDSLMLRNNGAAAPGQFLPTSPAEIAYRSDDGVVEITAAQVESWYGEFAGLAGCQIAGMIRHFDQALAAKNSTKYERLRAIPLWLSKQNVLALAKQRGQSQAAANGHVKPKRPEYESW